MFSAFLGDQWFVEIHSLEKIAFRRATFYERAAVAAFRSLLWVQYSTRRKPPIIRD
jgi:hypothetical protein